MLLCWPSTKIVQAIMIRQKKKKKKNKQKNMAARGRGLFSLYNKIENFKNPLVRNHWTDSNITWQECSFCDPLPSLFKLLWFFKENWPLRGVAYFPYISISKTLKFFLSETTWLISILLEMLLWWPSTKIVQAIMIGQKKKKKKKKTWPPGRGAIFPIYLYRKL